MTSTLVLLRHGQSTWNQRNLFTGWVDVDLTDPTATDSVTPTEQNGWEKAATKVTFAADDAPTLAGARVSGVRSITYSAAPDAALAYFLSRANASEDELDAEEQPWA